MEILGNFAQFTAHFTWVCKIIEKLKLGNLYAAN